MLDKYLVEIKGSEDSLDLFENALANMQQNKTLNKSNFHYFLGMHKNWFPLTLLGLYSDNLIDSKKKIAVGMTFIGLSNDNEKHSIYYKSKQRDTGMLSVVLHSENMPHATVGKILDLFDLDYVIKRI